MGEGRENMGEEMLGKREEEGVIWLLEVGLSPH